MKSNTETSAALILDIVDSVRKTRDENCAKLEAKGDSLFHEEWIQSMRAITVKEDIEDVLQVIGWSQNTGRSIESLEDFKAYSLWEAYYDLHKDAYGVKARHTNWFDHDAKGWQEAIDSLPSN